jgi:hypothetical protein
MPGLPAGPSRRAAACCGAAATLQKAGKTISQLNDVFCLSANFIFQHELHRQKILFKVLLSVCFFLNFCAWGCFFLFHYQTVTNYLENKLNKRLLIQNKVVSLHRDCN